MSGVKNICSFIYLRSYVYMSRLEGILNIMMIMKTRDVTGAQSYLQSGRQDNICAFASIQIPSKRLEKTQEYR